MQPGDHVYVQKFRLGSTALYTHHGVYVGNNQVIHYAGYANGWRDCGNQKVELISLQTFASGQHIQIKDYGSHRLPHSKAVVRAFERLHEDKYNLASNNCEHFANWCCTGEHRSEQVRRVTKRAGAALLTSTPISKHIAQGLLTVARRNPKAAIGVSVVGLLGSTYWALKQRNF